MRCQLRTASLHHAIIRLPVLIDVQLTLSKVQSFPCFKVDLSSYFRAKHFKPEKICLQNPETVRGTQYEIATKKKHNFFKSARRAKAHFWQYRVIQIY